LKEGSLEYKTVGKFLADLKKEFSGGDDETIKIVELEKVKQGSKTIEEFVQKFRRAARSSRYRERLLIKEFKRGVNRVI